jgi:hypothetical protein
MANVPTDREKARLQNTGMLNNVAGVLLAGLFSYLVFVLDKRAPGPVFWALIVGGATLLVISFIMSGRGIEKIGAAHNYFNNQALAVLAGFILLAASLLFLGPQTNEKSAAQLDTVTKDVARLEGQISAMGKTLEAERQRQDSDVAAITKLQGDIAELQKRCPPRGAKSAASKAPTKK